MAFSKVKLDWKVLSALKNNARFRSTATVVVDTPEKVKMTIDSKEIANLERSSSIWWDRTGQMRPLHSMNKLRIQLIRDCILYTKYKDLSNEQAVNPLVNLKIIDVGCGGGILSEPLARIGATVTGLDASQELINVAKEHASQDSSLDGKIEYICGCLEDHAKDRTEYYDAVIASEVIEHVGEKEIFMESIAKTLKPGGSVFVTTLNKTMMAWVLGVIAAEYVLNIVPQETHDWEKFLSPRDLQFMLEKYGCYTNLVHGFYYNVMRDEWFWTPSTAINYALHAVKKK